MTIGSQLKKAREKRKLTIQQAYQHTRIHPNILSAMEQDNFAQISNPIYLKSFLKEYSLYLGLDPRAMLDEYSKIKPKEPKYKAQPFLESEKDTAPKVDTRKFSKALKRAGFIVLIFFLLFVFIKATGLLKARFLNWRRLRAEQSEAARPKAGIELKKAPIAAEEKAGDARPKSRAAVTAQQHASAEKPRDSIPIPEHEKLNLVIKTTADVWIELKRDGGVVFKNVLKKDSAESWQADKDFELWTGNAAAMTIILNGRNLGSPGVGVRRGIIIDRQGIKK